MLLVESTYGDRRHDQESARSEFASVIERTLARGGYRDAVRERSPELRPEILARGEAALSPAPFLAARTVQESIDINSAHGPAVIVSSAGMATGGRVLHHLHRLLPDPRNAVVVVGFAAAGIRARDLVDGVRTLKMFGEYVPVRAEVADVPRFSAHADADQIVGWLRGETVPVR
ncbi:MBL fold metallo-hydrolase RNA specificity domain-containing protein [Streptomyces sp. NPDC020807]|uniref:MBL fold metallo-hydrolase RNA specificity domain-containing protein n=1 Tax=Streptomyces sp. NPDC020807 TaxID=3155119 RepID=UPI0033DC8163